MNLRLSRAQMAMAGLCALLALLLMYELMAPPTQFSLPDVHLKPKLLAIQPPPPFIAPPVGSFNAINDRPLFLPSRKAIAAPAAGPGAQAAGPPPMPNATLVGVIMDGQNSIAMVKVGGAPFAQAMGTGASIGDWQISAVGADRVELKSGSYTQELRMDAHAVPPSPSPAPGQTAPGTPQ
ncbi:MAG TPA: hypothetical protein VMH86_15095 [Rhizomicrobium sp.]|nr:hypothetical protein [Rhizomicrobium sp.]